MSSKTWEYLSSDDAFKKATEDADKLFKAHIMQSNIEIVPEFKETMEKCLVEYASNLDDEESRNKILNFKLTPDNLLDLFSIYAEANFEDDDFEDETDSLGVSTGMQEVLDAGE